MNIILFDNTARARLFPLTLTRAVADLRMGIFTVKERWEKITKAEAFVLTEEYLQPLYSPISSGTYVFVDACVFPYPDVVQRLRSLNEGEALFDQGSLVAGKVSIDSMPSISEIPELFKNVISTNSIKKLSFPHEMFLLNDEMLRWDYRLMTGRRVSDDHNDSVHVTRASDIFLEEDADVRYCNLNASTGPIYIGKNTTIMEGAFIRGPFALCDGGVVKMGAKIYGSTTVGPYSTVGGEIKNTVLTGYSNKAHDGYLGDSVIGEWCNLGAGTSNSNLKNSAGQINIWNYYENSFVSAGNKCGVIMGDYTRTSINTAINTGSMFGICCNLFGHGLTPNLVPNFSWGVEQQGGYDFEKAKIDIDNWKKLKNRGITDNEKAVLKHIFENYN